MKPDGSITAWGFSDDGGSGAPTDTGYTKIYSTDYAFAAMKADGSITAWGNSEGGPNNEVKLEHEDTKDNLVKINSDNTSESLIKKLWNSFMSLIKSIFN